MSIAIIDYGIGNLRSVEKAFTAQDIEAVVSRDEKVLRAADKLVLLGVGAFGYAMQSLRALGFDELVIEAANAGKPIIGLCVGLQMLFEEGHEFGVHQGLGLLPGKVVKFPDILAGIKSRFNPLIVRIPSFENCLINHFFILCIPTTLNQKPLPV
jgi:imidazole glycerol-phosphate synthase subunit HisH